MDVDNQIKLCIEDSVNLHKLLLEDSYYKEQIRKAAEMIVDSLSLGGKIHFCGNGGSAADAQHIAAELSGRFYFNRPPLNAEALHCNTSYLTAVANDFGYDVIFSRLLEADGRKGDVLVGISTSGNSKNILNAYDTAREKGIKTISFTGNGGGMMKDKSDILLAVPSNCTPRIQECHILIGHIICQIVENQMFGK
ncbi:MAG: D-sedoheptulose 7-phosphate isomerase [Bacteroidales bacterium]|jgi:D-sedoheptulose 7-phosphate isomerase|nr:D-sedoheptulose 7-phosphate isomerase [Bacteroidales bacterium]